MVTAYDFPSAKLAEAAGLDLLLVGDSLGTTVLGYPTTLPTTMDAMILHTAAVSRAVTSPMVIGDMPFLSFQVSVEEAVRNAGRFVVEGGAHAVKLEGVLHAEAISAILAAGIPVMGHLGYTPQRAIQFGTQIVRAKQADEATALLADARKLQELGCFALVLECIPDDLAGLVTEELDIPTIGIGAGPLCSGQVLVWHDLLGLVPGQSFKHNKRYTELGKTIIEALQQYVVEVRSGAFPDEAHCFRADPGLLEALKRRPERD